MMQKMDLASQCAPEEYETFQRASVVALSIPWELNSSRVRDLEIQGIQVTTSKDVWQAVVEKVDGDGSSTEEVSEPEVD